ncbi:unnamed protein product [Prunus armeniaca]
MDSIEFFQVFIIIIMTLFCMYFRSLTSSSSSTSSAAAVDTDIPHLQEKYDVFISFRGDEKLSCHGDSTISIHIHINIPNQSNSDSCPQT